MNVINEDDPFVPKPVSNFCKYHKKDTVGRPGRLVRGECKYRGTSSMAPRKTVKRKVAALSKHRGN